MRVLSILRSTVPRLGRNPHGHNHHHLPRAISTSSPSSSTSRPRSLQDQDLSNKTVLITGASQGIGLAIARKFAGLSARLILVGRREKNLETVREELGVGLDGKKQEHEIMVGDVGEVSFWKEGLKGLRSSTSNNTRTTKRIDILVNAAGITHASPLVTTSPDLITSIVNTNLLGTIWGCKIVGKEMLRQKEG